MSGAPTHAGLWPADRAGEDPMADAACRYVDAELFFPDNRGGGGPPAEARVTRAKQICRACPVRRRCLRQAVRDRELYGVWGGLTGQERRGLLKQVQNFRGLPAGVPARLQDGEPVRVRGQDRPAVAATLVRAGWSEQRICRALGIDPSELRAVLRVARRVLWVIDLVGTNQPPALPEGRRRPADPTARWRRPPGGLPHAA